MREIKFRGRFGGSWYFFDLPHWDFVEPDTLGQYTGLKDCEGHEIYEGDVVRIDDWSSPSYIRWDDVTASFVVDRWSVNLAHVSQIKVVGNIHDNPQLLKEGGENA